MKISVITPTLNHAEFIEDTIKSVLDQHYSEIDFFVVDGGSTDKTIEILEKYNIRYVSEKDFGQTNAINKGINNTQGEIVCWLNSDDLFNSGTVKTVVDYFEQNSDCMILYGDIEYIDRYGNFIHNIEGETLTFQSLLNRPDIVRQPSTFWRRSLHNDIGLLDENFHIIMDFDFIFRSIKKYKPHYIPVVLSKFRYFDLNKTNTSYKKQVYEFIFFLKKHHIFPGFLFMKFLVGRYLDSFNKNNPLRRFGNLLRKR